jgi:hypothetical protein
MPVRMLRHALSEGRLGALDVEVEARRPATEAAHASHLHLGQRTFSIHPLLYPERHVRRRCPSVSIRGSESRRRRAFGEEEAGSELAPIFDNDDGGSGVNIPSLHLWLSRHGEVLIIIELSTSSTLRPKPLHSTLHIRLLLARPPRLCQGPQAVALSKYGSARPKQQPHHARARDLEHSDRTLQSRVAAARMLTIEVAAAVGQKESKHLRVALSGGEHQRGSQIGSAVPTAPAPCARSGERAPG